MGINLCRHCGRHVVSRPRRLCWGCYYARGVRGLYRPDSIYAHRGVGHGSQAGWPDPTDALPGSEEKIQELERRAEMKLHLFHPDDERMDLS